ncbi:hypothetical protein PORCRE_1581 [Porphyromonas crevioricanis JCM 15906]|uniref:Uncharacterized protein n=1 Tax=Porphyromonas crevioricanis JCM 15906 TaxID=1305617 RepID=T1CPU8_9PORP|nr:hypothetical protein PORCRE_1581 [Porphyromonas crevioricanis JCM 15906]GAD07978.1 hypothetical protein PORCAN_1608 [Porphyromonas crevioricanis JCM 13913]
MKYAIQKVKNLLFCFAQFIDKGEYRYISSLKVKRRSGLVKN